MGGGSWEWRRYVGERKEVQESGNQILEEETIVFTCIKIINQKTWVLVYCLSVMHVFLVATGWVKGV
jgi:hypothetical protein